MLEGLRDTVNTCKQFRIVKELVGWVRNVVLINVYLDLENPGGSGFWVGGYIAR